MTNYTRHGTSPQWQRDEIANAEAMDANSMITASQASQSCREQAPLNPMRKPRRQLSVVLFWAAIGVLVTALFWATVAHAIPFAGKYVMRGQMDVYYLNFAEKE